MVKKRLNGGYRCSTWKVVEMMQKQNGKCYYCYKKFNVNDKYLKPTLDHMHARSKGGSETDENNVCISCFLCNMKKGQISIDKFLDGYVDYHMGGREQGDDSLQTIHTEKKIRGPRMFWHKWIGYSLK